MPLYYLFAISVFLFDLFPFFFFLFLISISRTVWLSLGITG